MDQDATIGKLSTISRYVLTVAFYLIALLIRFWIAPAESGFPFVTFYPAMVATFIYCGIYPGVAISLLSAVTALYIFIPPYWSFSATSTGYITTLTFLISAFLIGFLVRRLQKSETKFFRILEDAPVGMVTNDLQGHFIHVNQALCNLLGYKAEELLKMNFQDITYPEDIPLTIEKRQQLIDGRAHSYQLEKRYLCKDGSIIWVLLTTTIEKNILGEPPYFIAQVEDITERKRIEKLLKDSEQRYHFLFDESPMSIFVYDAKTFQFLIVNNQASRHYGYTELEFLSMTIPDIRFQKAAPELQSLLLISNDGITEFETRHVKKDGTVMDVYVRTAPFNFGDTQAHIAIIEDISERKKTEQMIWHQANFDLLTDLPNRSLFFDRLSKDISKARRTDKYVALLYLDLDGFKPINDLYGHVAGDMVLKTAAKRWQASVREMDTVVRLGGDEFAVILGELDSPSVSVAVAKKLIESLAVEIPLQNGNTCLVGTSIGIAIYPTNATEMDSLLLAADDAMYESKSRGKNTYTLSEQKPATNSTNEKWMDFSKFCLVDIPIVDEQHRELIRKVNNLNDAITQNIEDDQISALLNDLITFTKKHFETENTMMDELKYPSQQEHAYEHEHFLEFLSGQVVNFHNGNELLVLQQIKDWFLDHIQTFDSQLGDYLAALTHSNE